MTKFIMLWGEGTTRDLVMFIHKWITYLTCKCNKNYNEHDQYYSDKHYFSDILKYIYLKW